MRSSNFSLAALFLIGIVTPVMSTVRAEDAPMAVADQLIIVAPEGALRAKAIQLLENILGKDAVFADGSRSAVAVTIPSLHREPEGKLIDADRVEVYCRKVREYFREERRNFPRKFIRKFLCGVNGVIRLNAVPNDSLFGELWGLNQSNNLDMDLPEAWNLSTGSNEIVVGVIDTGIDYTHPDLAANMWKNPIELGGVTGVDDDSNGYVDDIYGINSITDSGDPMDDHYHGTHVAGTIGASGNNGQGVVGVNWRIKMIGVKFLNYAGSGTLADAIKCVDYLTALKLRGVNVLASNNSWGGGDYSPGLYAAMQNAESAGILFVAAAGNDNQNLDSSPSYPASYSLNSVIAVAAVDRNGNRASFSNYGANTVPVSAPGVTIKSSIPARFMSTHGVMYYDLDGTSMAAPHVTGALALVKSYAPNATTTDLKNILYTTGKYLPALAGYTRYQTMTSAAAMMNEASRLGLDGPTPTPVPTRTATPTPTPTATATATPTATPTATTAPGYWRINGTVRADGVQLANAKVILRTQGQEFVVNTDINGNYAFNSIYGPAQYQLVVVAGGYQFNAIEGMLTQHVQLQFTGIAKVYQLRVHVKNQAGTPIAGVTITDPIRGSGVTNSNGSVDFFIPYGVSYSATASKSGEIFLNPTVSGSITGDIERLIIQLPPAEEG